MNIWGSTPYNVLCVQHVCFDPGERRHVPVSTHVLPIQACLSTFTSSLHTKITCVKLTGNDDFDIPMGCFDGVEISKLLGENWRIL